MLESVPAATNKGGRPEGSVKTARSILKSDMAATSKLNKQMRELMADLLKTIREQIRDSTLSARERVEILQLLTASLQNSTKSNESIVKLLIASDEVDMGDDEKSPEELLQALRGDGR